MLISPDIYFKTVFEWASLAQQFAYFLRIANFWTQIFHKVCSDTFRMRWGYLNMTLLQIYYWDWQWKDFENRLGLIFGEVVSKSLYLIFWLTVYYY